MALKISTSRQSFLAGEKVSGQVVMSIDKATIVKNIRLHLIGETLTRSKKSKKQQDSSSGGVDQEDSLRKSSSLLSEPLDGKVFQNGLYRYHFQLEIPKEAAGSIAFGGVVVNKLMEQNVKYRVAYWLEAEMEMFQTTSQSVINCCTIRERLPIEIRESVKLSEFPEEFDQPFELKRELMKPNLPYDEKVHVKVSLERLHFQPGETILIHLEFKNYTRQQVIKKLQLYFKRISDYMVEDFPKRKEETVLKDCLALKPELKPYATIKLTAKLILPINIAGSSSRVQERKISIRYFFVVELEGWAAIECSEIAVLNTDAKR